MSAGYIYHTLCPALSGERKRGEMDTYLVELTIPLCVFDALCVQTVAECSGVPPAGDNAIYVCLIFTGGLIFDYTINTNII